MPKATLEFDLPEEKEAFNDALNGTKNSIKIENLWNDIFRPRHRHGYNCSEINVLLEDKKCQRLMDLIEKIYLETVHEE